MWLQKVKVRQFKSVHLNRVALAWVCHDRACLGKQNIGIEYLEIPGFIGGHHFAK